MATSRHYRIGKNELATFNAKMDDGSCPIFGFYLMLHSIGIYVMNEYIGVWSRKRNKWMFMIHKYGFNLEPYWESMSRRV